MMSLKQDINNIWLKPSHTGEKWSVKFGARSASVSPKDTSDMDTDEGQLITQQVLQTVLEYEGKRQRARDYKGLGLIQTSYMKKSFQNRLSYLVLLSLHLIKKKKTYRKWETIQLGQK